jgi:hypothetical protein
MKYIKTYESISDLASNSYHRRQEHMRTLEDMSLELWDESFNVQVSSEVLSRDDKYIIVNIVKRGSQNRFDYNEIKDTLLSMVSYMESEGYLIKSIEVHLEALWYQLLAMSNNLIPVELEGEELYLKYKPEQMVNYPIGQLIIKFQE